jgi:WD40 repeat protein
MKKEIISTIGCLLVFLVVYSQQSMDRYYQTIYASNLDEVKKNVREAENTLNEVKSGATFQRAIKLLKNAKLADPPPTGEVKNAIDEIIIHTQDEWVSWSDSQFRIAEQNRIKAEKAAARADSARIEANLAREEAKYQEMLALKNGREAEAGKLALLSSSKQANNQTSEALYLAFAALELEGNQKSTEMWRTFGEAALDTLSELILTNEIPIKRVYYLQKSDLFLLLHTDNAILLFDPNTKTKQSISTTQVDVPQIAVSDDEQFIAFTRLNYGVNIYSVKDRNSRLLGAHDHYIYHLKFSPDGRTLASSSRDKTVIIWDVENSTQSHIFNSHKTLVYQLEFSFNNQKLFGRSAKRTLLIWDLASRLIEKEIPAHDIYVKQLVVPNKGKFLLSAGSDGKVKTWNVQGEEQFSVDYEKEPLVKVFLPEGNKHIFTLTQGKKLFMSSLLEAPSTPKILLDQKVRRILMIDQNHMASLSDQDIDVFSKQGEHLCRFNGHDYMPLTVDHLKDSDLYLSVARDGSAQLWNKEGEVMLTIPVDPLAPLPAFFSFNGKGIYYFEKENKNLKFILLPPLLFEYLASNKDSFKKDLEKLKAIYELLFYEL